MFILRHSRCCQVHCSQSHLGQDGGVFETHSTDDESQYGCRREHIPWDDFTKTFRDAVMITRKLGLHYLWIDSLCIILDDEKDWAVKASRMASV